MEVDYYAKLKNLYNHCERIFEKAEGKRCTTVRKAAKAMRLQQHEVIEMAEDLSDQGYLIINISRMHFDWSKAEWELEPVNVGVTI